MNEKVFYTFKQPDIYVIIKQLKKAF